MALLISSLSAVQLQAQSLLNVQFGTATSPIQSGYNLIVLANGSGKGPAGNNTYTFSGLDPAHTKGGVTRSFTIHAEGGSPLTAGGEQNRDAGVTSEDSHPYANLYRSYIFTGRNDIRLQLTGLVPRAEYSIQAWSYCRTSRTAGTIYYRTFDSLTGNSIGASACVGAVDCPAGSSSRPTPTDPSSSSLTFKIVADSSGKVVFGVSNIDSSNVTHSTINPIINGFMLVANQNAPELK